jgi:hypothetical protein
MFPTLEEWEARATKVYEAARDLDKRIAIHEIARGLMDAFTEGSEHVFESIKLAKAPSASEKPQ